MHNSNLFAADVVSVPIGLIYEHEKIIVGYISERFR